MSWFDGLLWPIMVAVAWIMVQFHKLFSAMRLDPNGGAAWSLSIVGLVLVIRVILIPLFVRQIKASRGMQLIQPELQAIQKKYKGKTDPASREAMSRETMELYKKHGTNPFSSCLPILAQSPIFFALFRVLNSLSKLAAGTYPKHSIGPMTQDLAFKAEHATVFGAPLSGTFMLGTNTATRVVTVVLIVAMSVTTFTTQRQLTMKNMPPQALEGPIAQQQKMLLYIMPLIFAFSGINFPIGVLIYWTVSNLWTMGQQFYTIRRMPAPGSQAEKAMLERKARKQSVNGTAVEAKGAVLIDEAPRPTSGQRQQPVRKDRQKKPVQKPSENAVNQVPAAPLDDDWDSTPPATPAGSGPARPKKPRTSSPTEPTAPPRSIEERPATGAEGATGPARPAKPRTRKPPTSGSGAGQSDDPRK